MPTGAGGKSGVGSLGGCGLSGDIVAIVDVEFLGNSLVCFEICARRSRRSLRFD